MGWWMDKIHTGLDVVGMIPAVGNVADLANAGLYAIEGDAVNAGISLAGCIPGAGQAATGARVATKLGKEVLEEAVEKGVKEVAEQTLKKGAKKKAAKESGEEVVEEGAEAATKEVGTKFSKSQGGGKGKKPRQPRKYEKRVINEDGSVTYTFKKKNGELVDVTYRNGYPDFEQHLYKGSGGKPQVEIKMTGNNNTDFKAANNAAGFGDGAKSHPDGYTWHHHQDGKTMQLVEQGAHNSAPHTGGASAARAGQ